LGRITNAWAAARKWGKSQKKRREGERKEENGVPARKDGDKARRGTPGKQQAEICATGTWGN